MVEYRDSKSEMNDRLRGMMVKFRCSSRDRKMMLGTLEGKEGICNI